jgi:hypothetical protein
MIAEYESEDKRIADPFSDRRSGDDRRGAYDLDYFEQGGQERRQQAERRTTDERRGHCTRVSEWSSVCPPEEQREDK